MARVGKSIEHPLSGERLTFLETAATTGGGYLKMRIEMSPGGTLPKPHTHPSGPEEFEVVEGRVQMEISGRRRVAGTGETVVVPSRAGHFWANPFDEPAAVVVTLRPALNMETFFEMWFGLARDGRVDPNTQMPGFLQLMAIAHEYRDGIGQPGLLGYAIRGAAPMLARLARARGYLPRYPEYSDPGGP